MPGPFFVAYYLLGLLSQYWENEKLVVDIGF